MNQQLFAGAVGAAGSGAKGGGEDGGDAERHLMRYL